MTKYRTFYTADNGNLVMEETQDLGVAMSHHLENRIIQKVETIYKCDTCTCSGKDFVEAVESCEFANNPLCFRTVETVTEVDYGNTYEFHSYTKTNEPKEETTNVFDNTSTTDTVIETVIDTIEQYTTVLPAEYAISVDLDNLS